VNSFDNIPEYIPTEEKLQALTEFSDRHLLRDREQQTLLALAQQEASSPNRISKVPSSLEIIPLDSPALAYTDLVPVQPGAPWRTTAALLVVLLGIVAGTYWCLREDHVAQQACNPKYETCGGIQ
jgi:hypothetical protein